MRAGYGALDGYLLVAKPAKATRKGTLVINVMLLMHRYKL